MKIIGLTGGIGSGKTLISTVFRQLLIPVYNSDTQAKVLMNTNKKIIQSFIELFGKDIYLKNGLLDKKKMGGYIFSDKSSLKKVNNIVHPIVREDFGNWVNNQNSSYIIKEAAILFESGSYKDMNKVITVYCPEEIRIRRIIERDGLSVAEIKKRIQNQTSDDEKIKMSDFVIYNDERQLILPQILKLHENLKKL